MCMDENVKLPYFPTPRALNSAASSLTTNCLVCKKHSLIFTINIKHYSVRIRVIECNMYVFILLRNENKYFI